jgi:DNA-binding IclR family transcriptional regulator
MTVAALAPTGSDGELRSVSIAVGVLDCFTTAGELGPTQVARMLGIAKSTASRMLSTLATGGMLERTPVGRYRLGLRLVQYGQLAIDRLPLRAVARPVLLDLHESVRETVQLGLPVGGHVLYVERLGTGGPAARLAGEVFRRVPGFCSSSGRIMAAFDPQVALATEAVERRKQTRLTITDPRQLQRILQHARRTGWIGSREECAPGYSSIAAPILVEVAGGPPRVAGAVCVVGATGQILGPRKDFIAASVCRAARRVGAGLAARVEA